VASQVYLVSSGRKEEKGKRMYLKNFLNKSLTIDYKCRTVAKQFGIYAFFWGVKDGIATTCQNSWLSFLLLKEIAENLWFCKDNSVKR
jgi:hypothetical protein